MCFGNTNSFCDALTECQVLGHEFTCQSYGCQEHMKYTAGVLCRYAGGFIHDIMDMKLKSVL